MEVGLDIGTGFSKVSADGKKISFPSIYSCRYSDGRKKIEDAPGKPAFEETVGMDAIHMAKSSTAIQIRPVRYGMPHNLNGFEKLVRRALESLHIEPSDAVIAVGVTWDARKSRKNLEKLFQSRIRPKWFKIYPQAYGCMVNCNKKEGTVINIGHGTTEVIQISRGQSPVGHSIEKAGSFITTQLNKNDDMYVHHGKLFAENPSMTAKYVNLLAQHIADRVSRMNYKNNDVILAGGGSLIPGMRETMESILGITVTVPNDPVFANAQGLEILAGKYNQKSGSPSQVSSGSDGLSSDSDGIPAPPHNLNSSELK